MALSLHKLICTVSKDSWQYWERLGQVTSTLQREDTWTPLAQAPRAALVSVLPTETLDSIRYSTFLPKSFFFFFGVGFFYLQFLKNPSLIYVYIGKTMRFEGRRLFSVSKGKPRIQNICSFPSSISSFDLLIGDGGSGFLWGWGWKRPGSFEKVSMCLRKKEELWGGFCPSHPSSLPSYHAPYIPQ